MPATSSSTSSSRARRHAMRLVLSFGLAGCVFTRPFRDANGRIIAGSIASMETITIGGIPQRFLVSRSKRRQSGADPASWRARRQRVAAVPALQFRTRAALRDRLLGSTRCRPLLQLENCAGNNDYCAIRQRSWRGCRDGEAALRKKADHPAGAFMGHHPGTIYTYEHPENVAAYAGAGQIADVPRDEKVSWEFDLAMARER